MVDLGGGDYGIATDSDLRSKVIAGPLSPDDPVSAAMTTPVVGVTADQTGADVMLTMLDYDARHVPVFSRTSELLGVIVAIDLVAAETGSPFVLRRAIAKARNKRELTEAASRLNSTIITLLRAELAPSQVSEVTSAVADALIARMIELASSRRARRLPSSAGCRWEATAGGSRCRPPTSTRAWPGGTCPSTIPLPPRPGAIWPQPRPGSTCAGSRPTWPTASG